MLALVVCLIGSYSATARAKVADMDFKELVAYSDAIVVVTVTKVEPTRDGDQDIEARLRPLKVATARVVETWKGAVAKDVRFVASPTWTCDIAGAREGEKLALFLVSQADSPIMRIVHSGRGRMLLHDVKGMPYATVDHQVIFPAGTKTISEKKTRRTRLPALSFEAGKPLSVTDTFTYEVRSIELGTLRALVQREVDRESAGKERLVTLHALVRREVDRKSAGKERLVSGKAP